MKPGSISLMKISQIGKKRLSRQSSTAVEIITKRRYTGSFVQLYEKCNRFAKGNEEISDRAGIHDQAE